MPGRPPAGHLGRSPLKIVAIPLLIGGVGLLWGTGESRRWPNRWATPPSGSDVMRSSAARAAVTSLETDRKGLQQTQYAPLRHAPCVISSARVPDMARRIVTTGSFEFGRGFIVLL